MTLKLAKFICISLLIICSFMYTNIFANQAARDSNFNTGLPVGFDNIVKTIKVQANGKVIAGGIFTLYNGISTNYITRLNADGGKDSSFNIGNGFNSGVNTIAIQSDGKILVGGQFTSYNSITNNKLIRLNIDGYKDSSFDIGNGFNSGVNTIAIQSDGKIIVGGSFTNYNGTTTNRIVRLNPDGSRDTSFNIGAGFDNSIDVLTIQDDGKILLGGQFTSYDGTTASRLIRLNIDGSKDSNFDIGTGFNSTANTIAIQTDGKIIVGGDFTSYDGTTANKLIRLNADGGKDSSFNVGTGFNSTASTIAIQTDGKIIVGGNFTSYSGFSTSKIIRLNPDGSRDSSFNIGIGFNSTNSVVNTIAIQTDGKIIVGGSFMTYNWIAINRIVRLNTDGSRSFSFDIGNGFNSLVNAVATQSDGKILVGGQFTSYGGTIVNRITRLNIDGSKDSSFTTGSLANDNINSIAIQTDGKIIIGGNFVTYGAESLNRITRLNTDGSRDQSFNIGVGFNNNVSIVAIQSDGKILVGGQFTSYSGTITNRIIRLNTNGSRDSSFNIGSGFDNSIDTIAIQTDGKILVGGGFTTYSGIITNRIVRLNTDGSKDDTFNIGNGFNATISASAIQDDGKILLGGQFTSYSGYSINRIIRLNSDGSRDSSFNIGNGFNNVVRDISIKNDNKIIVGGSFNTYSGITANYIIGLNTDGSRDFSFDIGNGFNDIVRTLSIQQDNKILVGGNFTSYGQGAAGFLILLYGNTDVVILPNSTDSNIIKNEFTSKGYTQLNGDLVGSKSISLSETNGNIPTALSIKNDDIKLSITADTQFKKSDNTTNYNGIISVPITKSINSINNEVTLSAFKVGSSTEAIKLTGGVATLSLPAPGKTVGDIVEVYYSEDNGVTRYPQITTTVINIGGQPYVEFTTNHFTDFAITTPIIFTGTFTINNDAISTTSNYVNLDISTTPAASKMRFSDDGVTRPSRENYATTKSWTLPGTYESKTVYAQFSIYGDGTVDVETSDSIDYIDPNGGGGCVGGGPGTACLSLEIMAVTGECRYGQNLDLGDHAQQYSTFNMTGAFTGNNNTYPLRWSCNDTAGKSPINRDMQISSTDLIATGAGGNQYIISSDQIEIKTDISKVYQGDASVFTGEIGSFLDRGTNITIPKIIFKKTSPQGTVGELGTDSVDLRVIVPANQEIGQYQATITIAFPQM